MEKTEPTNISPVKQLKVNRLLDEMITADKKLYEQILDTQGFAKAFNDLVLLAMKN